MTSQWRRGPGKHRTIFTNRLSYPKIPTAPLLTNTPYRMLKNVIVVNNEEFHFVTAIKCQTVRSRSTESPVQEG